jgi:hypothetical protein
MIGPVHVCPLFIDNGDLLNEGKNNCGSCINYRKDETEIGCTKHNELVQYIIDNYGGNYHEG